MGVYQKFSDALLFGNSAQDAVTDVLRSHGAMCNRKDDYARYDFEMTFNNHAYKVEVKNEDNKACIGNICVETRQGWPLKKSGVAYSEAQVFIHTLQDMCALYRSREMLEWLRYEVKYGHRFEARFGDNNNRGFILPIAELQQFDWFDYISTCRLHASRLWTY